MILPKIKKGFTLIEILLVVAILAILLVVVFAALNPAQRLADTRDARRWNDVNNLLTAVHECIVDDGTSTALATCAGTYVDDEIYEVVSGAVASACDDICTGATSDTHCLNWGTTLSSYLASVPEDPSGTAADGHSEYLVSIDANGLVTVSACSAEGGTISVSR
jgi:prepilin-type N-terminal cleavage/methylation domain-containing protein